jgi:uncharacterized membrane protein
MAKRKSKQEEMRNRKFIAFIASFFTIVGFLIALIFKRDDDYIMHYAGHGLVLFIYQIVIYYLRFIPFVERPIPLLTMLWIVLWVITWVNALSGKKKGTILVEELAKFIKI